MAEQPLSVSVALATCNGERHIAAQLADLSAQSRLPSEVVVCDDASADDTLSIVTDFASSAPFPVHIHRNEARLGYRRNFLRCARLCSSDLVAFCDQDDRWLPHKLESLLSLFADPEVLLVFHNAEVITEDNRRIASLYPHAERPTSWKPLGAPPWLYALGFVQVFRRSLVALDIWWENSQDQNFDGERLAHDQWTIFLASVLGTVVFHPAELAQYRQHDRNLFGWRSFAPSFLSRVAAEISGASRSMVRRANAADGRAAILERAAAELEEPWRGRALAGSFAYREFGERCWLRAALYNANRISDRCRALRELFRAQAYGRDTWRFGPLALAMDLTIGAGGLYPSANSFHSPMGRRGDAVRELRGRARRDVDLARSFGCARRPARAAQCSGDAAVRPLKLLSLTPFPPDLAGTHGGARATAAIVDALSRKHEVHLLYLEPADFSGFRQAPAGCKRMLGVRVGPARKPAEPLWVRAYRAARALLSGTPDWVRDTWSPQLAAVAARLASELKPDVIHFEFHVMGQYVPLVRKAAPDAACIVTEHEPGVVAAASRIGNRGMRSWVSGLASRRAWASFEKRSLSDADAVITFTEEDRDAVSSLIGTRGPELACIPLRLWTGHRDCRANGRAVQSDLLFIGNFQHPPNVDAAVRLASGILPKIREALPFATLHIVGADPPRELFAAAGPGTIVTGYVDDVGPYLAGASVFVAPLREGGGLRVKVLEACAAGKAIVASPLAVQGLGIRDGLEFVLADSDEEFAGRATGLLSDPGWRAQLGSMARLWAQRTQDVEEWGAEYDALYARLASRPREDSHT